LVFVLVFVFVFSCPVFSCLVLSSDFLFYVILCCLVSSVVLFNALSAILFVAHCLCLIVVDLNSNVNRLVGVTSQTVFCLMSSQTVFSFQKSQPMPGCYEELDNIFEVVRYNPKKCIGHTFLD
jgi:hypothetical protein